MLFRWARDPEPTWEADLARLSPRQDRLSHLELWWEAGFPWAPVQRWVLYQLQPLLGLPESAALDWATLIAEERPCTCAAVWVEGGICGRCYGTWPCACGAQHSAESIRCRHCRRVRSQGRHLMVDAFVRGYHAQPFWVIQGEHGGHKVSYTTVEAELAGNLGMSRTPPEPGSLPYAEWDGRVRANLRAYDLATSAFSSLRTARRQGRGDLERLSRAAQERYLTGVMHRVQDETPDTILDHVPRIHGTRGADEAEASARYIETGAVT